MKKIIISFLSLLALVTLGGCQSKFNPQTALEESRTTLNEFINLYSDNEEVSDKYNKENLEKFFTDNQTDYFSKNFQENILPDKLDNLEYDSSKEWAKIGEQFLFLTVSSKEKGIFWNKVEIKDDSIDTEKEAATFYVSSKNKSYPSRYVEMIKEKGKWKINNILDI